MGGAFDCQNNYRRGVPVAQTGKNPPAMQETWVPSLSQEDPLEWDLFPSTGGLLDPRIEPASFVFPVLAEDS